MLPNVAAITNYGNIKQNYAPVEDATTDESADERNQYVSDVAGMTNTCIRAWCTFVGKASSPPDDPASNVHGAVWGSAVGVKPVVARVSTGVYTVTWTTPITDALGTSRALAFRWCLPPSISGSTPYYGNATCTANVVTVRIYNTAGGSVDPIGANVTVFVI